MHSSKPPIFDGMVMECHDLSKNMFAHQRIDPLKSFLVMCLTQPYNNPSADRAHIPIEDVPGSLVRGIWMNIIESIISVK
jgi:hypothetical protein